MCLWSSNRDLKKEFPRSGLLLSRFLCRNKGLSSVLSRPNRETARMSSSLSCAQSQGSTVFDRATSPFHKINMSHLHTYIPIIIRMYTHSLSVTHTATHTATHTDSHTQTVTYRHKQAQPHRHTDRHRHTQTQTQKQTQTDR